MRRLNDNEFAELAQYEDNFRIALQAQWAKNPGPKALTRIHEIYTGATGDPQRLNTNCNHCIFTLLKDAGTFYFREKEAREKEAKKDEGKKEVQTPKSRTRKKSEK